MGFRNIEKRGMMLVALLTGFFLIMGFGAAEAEASSDSGQSMSTTLEDQSSVAVTIYNDNLGLVKDIREIGLPRGTGSLRFMDVASQIIPASVYIRSLLDSDSLLILEQNYEYDLLNPQKLLDKYIGRKIKLYVRNDYSEREDIIEATVLSNNGGPIFQIGDEITYGHPGRIIFPGVPEDLISKPTLVWLLDNSLSSLQKVEASYLTGGIGWNADYVLTLNENDDRADLSGWVTIDNRSGTTYRDAKLKLVAGDVNRVKEEYAFRDKAMYAASVRPGKEQFEEDALFEYHIYTLQRPSTIRNNQTKQLSLISADAVPVKKELAFYGAPSYYRSRYGEKMPDQKVGVFIEIDNRKENNLGMPLPKGTVRVYKHDKEGSLQFVGEDAIDHTPEDETIRVKMGDAFDVVGSRKQTDWKKIAADTYEAGFEILLRNHKEEEVKVKIIEQVPGDWEMISSSHDYSKTGAFAAEFNVPVPKGGETRVTYKVRMRF